MTDMADRVARAIYLGYLGLTDSPVPVAVIDAYDAEVWRRAASAAIEAMPVEPHWRLTNALEECIWFIDHMPVAWAELPYIKATLKAARDAGVAEVLAD